jgi:hypothetical protein
MKDKKQIIQIVALGVLLLSFVGYLSFKLMTPKAAAPKPVVEASKPADTVKAEATPETTPTPGAVPTPLVAVQATNMSSDISPGSGLRDPFAPAIIPLTSIPIQPRNHTQLASNAHVPPMAIPPIGAAGDTQATAQPQPDPMPQFVLTGVVTGRKNIAIVKLGEARYIVEEGRKINGLYQVVSVSQEGVLLSHNGQSVFLKLGGDGNAIKN